MLPQVLYLKTKPFRSITALLPHTLPNWGDEIALDWWKLCYAAHDWRKIKVDLGYQNAGDSTSFTRVLILCKLKKILWWRGRRGLIN